MNIVVAVRCYNEEKNIERFLRGYDFCDHIVISDGGSTDRSVEIIKEHQKTNPKIHLLKFEHHVVINGEYFNEDAPHMNFVLDAAKELKPDILIFDDMDDVPNWILRKEARRIFEANEVQFNAFRLYMWGDTHYFPYMNRNFDPSYRSLWAWRPNEIDIRADPAYHHGTLTGLHPDPYPIALPFCLLHKSWHPDTVQRKVDRYNALGIPNDHPLDFAGKPEPLPEWAVE